MNAKMQTYTGKKFEFVNTDPESINILDIAMHLSKTCRFNGACTRFYSVGEHSILVSRVVPPELALQGLMHDAAEAYTPDVQADFKKLLFETSHDVREIFVAIETAVAAAFNLPWPPDPRVKEVDQRMCATEKQQLMAPATFDWQPLPEPYSNVAVIGADPPTIATDFLDRFNQLWEGE